MRIYTESSEESLRARKHLKQWSDDGSLCSKEQYQRLETRHGLRSPRHQYLFEAGTFLLQHHLRGSRRRTLLRGLSFAAVGANFRHILIDLRCCLSIRPPRLAGVTQAHLYRYGIEEALAICSIALLCAGLEGLFFSGFNHSSREIQFVVPAVGAIASLWIWYRFNLWYAFPAAMIFAIFLPGYWTSSHSAQHIFIAVLYVAGLICIAPIRSGHRFDYLENAYSLAEAFLWLGIYLTFNLKISAFSSCFHIWGEPTRGPPSGPAEARSTGRRGCSYGACRPSSSHAVFARRIASSSRSARLLPSSPLSPTNHTSVGSGILWDPILLGIALTVVALFLRRWLALGPGGVRHGFTAARLSGKDKHTMSVGSAVLGLITPQSITPTPQPTNPDFRFGGGGSGGGGASGDF